MEEVIKIKASWDVDNATYLTRHLYKYVAKGNIKFSIEAKKGSVETEFLISVIRDITPSYRGVVDGLSVYFLAKLIELIYKHLKREREMGRHPKDVEVIVAKPEKIYIITGDKRSQMPEGLKYKLMKNESI